MLPEALGLDGAAGLGTALGEPPGAELAERHGGVGRQRFQAEPGPLGLALQVDGRRQASLFVVALVATLRRRPVASLKLAHQVPRFS